MPKKKKFKVKKRFTFSDKLLHCILRIPNRKAKVINTTGEPLPKQCILIANHHGAAGPVNIRLFIKDVYMTWCAHQMCERYPSRWRYAYHTYYRKKLKYNKVKAFFKATLLAFINPWTYKYTGAIPVYYDSRIINTYRNSIECIENNVPVLIFPENSNEGYKKVLEEFWGGFLAMSRLYYKKNNVDLPIYTLRFCTKPKRIIIGTPLYYNELSKTHTDEEILKMFVTHMNELGAKYLA